MVRANAPQISTVESCDLHDVFVSSHVILHPHHVCSRDCTQELSGGRGVEEMAVNLVGVLLGGATVEPCFHLWMGDSLRGWVSRLSGCCPGSLTSLMVIAMSDFVVSVLNREAS